MKMISRMLFVLVLAFAGSSCAHQSPKPASHKKLKLETIDHGPMRPKTYLYREVDDR
jgi:hypothetical protein